MYVYTARVKVERHMSLTQYKLGKYFVFISSFISNEFGSREVQCFTRS